jgi:uncharacterized protein YkwD
MLSLTLTSINTSSNSISSDSVGDSSEPFGAIATLKEEREKLPSVDSSSNRSGTHPLGFDDYPWHDADFLRDALWDFDLFDDGDFGWNITYANDTEETGADFPSMPREWNSSSTTARARQKRSHRRLLRVNSAELHNAMYIQYERVVRGLGRIAWSGDLVEQAQEWAEYMASANRIEHRFDLSSGVEGGWTVISENVCMNHRIDRDGAHSGLMNSEGHRANILDSRINRIGIGVRQSGPYYFMCQIFKSQVY